MLILSSMAVLVLMMSVVTLLGWGLIRLVRAVRRAYQERPRYVGIVERYQTPYVEENFKRAGQ